MRNRRQHTKVNSRRWAAYVAAGVSGLVCSQTATADITYAEPGLELRDSMPGDGFFGEPYAATFGDPGAQLVFLMASDETGLGEGVFALRATRLTSQSYFQMSFAGNQVSGYNYVQNVQRNAFVSQLNMISGGTSGDYMRGDLAWASGYYGSQFLNQGGYIGFQFNVGNGTQYGWAEVSLDQGVPANQYTLERIAWADAGESLRVGQVPEPGSLGLLAMGATGLLLWRKSKN